MGSDAARLSLRWRRAARSLDGGLRAAYLKSESRAHPFALVVEALDAVCAAAEQAEPEARELLVTMVDWLGEPGESEFAHRLRQEASIRSCLALARLLRRPVRGEGPGSVPPGAGSLEGRVPEYVPGRSLTLGERKALARRPTRGALEKLFSDPHPVVIRTLLGNPKVVEADVVRLAARRPGHPEVLAEIARAHHWAHRIRVRMSLVLNPYTPLELTVLLLALLDSTQLREVATSADLAPVLRAAAHDLLVRRPPVHLGAHLGVHLGDGGEKAPEH